MDDKTDDRTSFLKRLDQAESVAVGIGLVASGVIFAAGLGGLLFVIFHVFSTKPPSWGSQAEWLYGALACLLVAGYGFGQARASLRTQSAAENPRKLGPQRNSTLGATAYRSKSDNLPQRCRSRKGVNAGDHGDCASLVPCDEIARVIGLRIAASSSV
jgi:hypothetical protein